MAICAGCGRTHQEVGGYDDDDPVTRDGSYADGKFVCDDCYIRLIGLGKDKGNARQLQEAAATLLGGKT